MRQSDNYALGSGTKACVVGAEATATRVAVGAAHGRGAEREVEVAS